MNLQRRLDELRRERQWLDGIIGALEMASRCPTPQFLMTLAGGLGDSHSPGSAVGMERRQKRELARLARLVRQHCGQGSGEAPKRHAGPRAMASSRRAGGGPQIVPFTAAPRRAEPAA